MFSIYEIRILEVILEHMEKYHTTPSLTQIAEKVYDDSTKKTAVHYHVEALRDAGVISDAPELRGRIALNDPEAVKQQIEHDRAIYAAEADMKARRQREKVHEDDEGG
jgi:SOS-response transcriptional repressor LexA